MVNKSWTFSGGGTRALLVVASLFFFFFAHAFASEPRRVLIIHAFGHAYSPWSTRSPAKIGRASCRDRG